MTEQKQPEREFTRVTTRFNIEVAIGERTIRSGQTRDLSMKGVYVVCDEELPAGAECRIAIRLSESDEGPVITARGEVIRADAEPSGFAVEFSEVDLESYEHLRKMVMLNSSEPDKVEKEINEHLGLKRP